MPNLAAAQIDSFIPEIWANRALQKLRANIVLARLVTKDTDIAEFRVGDVLNVPVPGAFVANDKATQTAVTLQSPSSTSVNVTLDKHKEVSFLIEDVGRAQANQDVIDRHVSNATIALAEQIETDLFVLYDNLSTNVGTAAVDLVASTIRAARKQLNTNKAPLAQRFCVFNPASEISLLADAELRDYFANSQPTGVSEGSMGRVYGFDMYMSQICPGTSPAKGIAGTPEAGVLAMRSLPVTGAPGVSQMAMRDPVSGLVLRLTASYDTDYLGMKVTLDCLYGIKELRDGCGVQLRH
jgi:hypothetical protein